MKNKVIKFILLLSVFCLFGFYSVKAVELDETEAQQTTIESSNDKQEEVEADEDEKKETNSQGKENENTLTESEDTESDESESEKGESSNEEGTKEGATDEVITDDNSEPQDETTDETTQSVNQKVKVIIEKKDEEGNFLEGAILQLKNSNGKVIKTWKSGDTPEIVYLEDGKYTVHELLAPEGYNIAEDKEFTVKVVIPKVEAGADYSAAPCPHYYGTPMYYVEIEGKKNEVYCINQNWETPDEESTYSGGIISPDNIREYTKQTTPIGIDENSYNTAILSDGPIDVSDQTLNNQELYDKILNIIYHRQIASEMLSSQGLEYSVEEIRYITEVALKNYTNPGLAELQWNIVATDALLNAFDAAGVVYHTYMDGTTKKVSYLKHNYRDYVYTPDVELGHNISTTDYGNGNSFGQMVAGHFNSYSSTKYLHPDSTPETQAHNAKNDPAERAKVARYYELFKFLISDDNPHPSDMQIYIYSSKDVSSSVSGNNHDNGKYQNLLGVTGYVETEYEQEPVEVEIINTYKEEKTNISVVKIWEDKKNYNKVRPKTVTVNLKANNKIIKTVVLSKKTGWKYTFEDLDVYNKGEKINYTITENKVKKYDTVIKGDATVGFKVVNTYYGKGGDNPLTADYSFIYIVLVVLGLSGIIRCSYLLINNKNL